MKLKVGKNSILIFSETEADVAYIRDTLGLERLGDKVTLRLETTMNDDPMVMETDNWGTVETKHTRAQKERDELNEALDMLKKIHK